MEDEKIKIVIKSIIDENDYIDNNKKNNRVAKWKRNNNC